MGTHMRGFTHAGKTATSWVTFQLHLEHRPEDVDASADEQDAALSRTRVGLATTHKTSPWESPMADMGTCARFGAGDDWALAGPPRGFNRLRRPRRY